MSKRIFTLGAPLALSLLLAACGGEREEPFNPSEPEEVRDPVAVSFVFEDSSTDDLSGYPSTDVASRRLEIIRDAEDFGFLTDLYSNEFVTEPDFEQGQVVLYDSGWFDDSVCAQQLNLDRIQAFSITEDESVVEVVLTYRRSEADEDADCDDAEIPLRTWEFHYIETRADLVVVEEVRGLDTGSSGSQSSSSSSQSSSSSSESASSEP